MGKPPVPVAINMALSAVGFGLAIYGAVISKPAVSFIGAGMAALSFVLSLLFVLRLKRRGQFK